MAHKTISIDDNLIPKLNALADSDNRTLSNVCETILKVFFQQNPKAKTIIESRVKHKKLSDMLNDYNDKLLERWMSGSKQDFTEFVEEYLSNNNVELLLSPYKYTENDMKQFADWCRVALLNSEYSLSKLNKHLNDWESLSKN